MVRVRRCLSTCLTADVRAQERVKLLWVEYAIVMNPHFLKECFLYTMLKCYLNIFTDILLETGV